MVDSISLLTTIIELSQVSAGLNEEMNQLKLICSVILDTLKIVKKNEFDNNDISMFQK